MKPDWPITHGSELTKVIAWGHTHRPAKIHWWQFIKKYKNKKYRRMFYTNFATLDKSDGQVPKYK